VKGPVEKVCKTMGCWMIMKSKDTAVRITFKDYGFVVNPTLLGKTAWVEGQLQKKNLTMEETRHLVKDEGGDPKSVKEPVTEWQLVAVGVKIP
jgi:hypothetical protein